MVFDSWEVRGTKSRVSGRICQASAEIAKPCFSGWLSITACTEHSRHGGSDGNSLRRPRTPLRFEHCEDVCVRLVNFIPMDIWIVALRGSHSTTKFDK